MCTNFINPKRTLESESRLFNQMPRDWASPWKKSAIRNTAYANEWVRFFCVTLSLEIHVEFKLNLLFLQMRETNIKISMKILCTWRSMVSSKYAYQGAEPNDVDIVKTLSLDERERSLNIDLHQPCLNDHSLCSIHQQISIALSRLKTRE